MTDHSLLVEIYKHVEIMNAEMGDLAQRVAILETQVEGIMWLQRAILGAMIVLMVAAIWRVIIYYRKNNK